MVRVLFLLCALLALCIHGVEAQSIDIHALTRPGTDNPDTVRVKLVFDIASIDESSETFEMDTYLYLYWQDERLAFDGEELGFYMKNYTGAAAAELLKTEIWSPYLEITDALSRPEADVPCRRD